MDKVINQAIGQNYALYNGDCCEVIKNIPDDSIHFSIFSPPFSSLYIYSNSERDMGNCKDDAEFFEHFDFLIAELMRITIPGRLVAMHVKNLPKYKTSSGVTGLKDFRGACIRAMEKRGWVLHTEVCIWTDPVFEMQRTKTQRLLHKQVKQDASLSGMGVPEYLCVFRKWDRLNGQSSSPVPVLHEGGFDKYHGTDAPKQDGNTSYSIDVWQRYASPVWFDIMRTDVLNHRIARSNEDEKHIAPLQLTVIRRAVHLWTNPDEVVFTPFMGIGSEAYVALQEGRKAIGIELKEEYFAHAVKNIESVVNEVKQASLL